MAFRIEWCSENRIATIWMEMNGGVNKINPDFGQGFAAAFAEVKANDALAGIIVTSGHKDFCVGADIDFVYQTRNVTTLYEDLGQLHENLRTLETLGKPVVAALNGSALGGGYELALACHYRIAIDKPSAKFGLPEVAFGLIPGGGGCQRLPRLIGIQPALEVIAQGQMLRPSKALKKKLIDELAEDQNQLFEKAHAWIKAHPKIKQPWDERGFTFPGGVQPESEMGRQLFAGGAAMLLKKTSGAYRAPEAAIQAVYEGCHLDFDTALKVEGRYFAHLVASDQSKDMIRTFWYHKNQVDKQVNLPKTDLLNVKKVAVLGAGMMGAGLAFVCAKAGYEVVLRDLRQEALDLASKHLAQQAKKGLKHLDPQGRQEVLDRITPTLEIAQVKDSDLVIEAVVEDLAVKHAVIREIEPLMNPDGIFASNTSALPITDLSEASIRPTQFIGLHFFSPVEQMPLLEIITSKQTSNETLARCLGFGDSIKKTSIVVNDGYGFYTTRLFSCYVMEAAQMVAEGFRPLLVERAARKAGMVVSPLKVFDEVSLSLAEHGFKMRENYTGEPLDHDGVRLVRKMIEHQRLGKASGKGFYEYTDGPRRLWHGLEALAVHSPPEMSDEEQLNMAADRLMLVQALEAVRCLDEGVLRSKADGEIGAIFGLGFAPNTGGPFAWLDRFGVASAVTILDQLTQKFGERYAPSKSLRAMAENGGRFFDWV